MTSGQYSYMLLRRMQLYVSCDKPKYRAYLYNFFGEIFNDPSVVIDEASYLRFVEQLESEVDYCAKKDLHTMESVYEDESFGDSYTLLQNSFASIGVDMVLTHENEDGTGNPKNLVFTLPSGEQKILDIQMGGDLDMLGMSLYVRSQMRVTDSYFERMRSYYLLEDDEILDLREIGTQSAGYNTRWQYDTDTATLEIQGSGTLTGAELWGLLGIDTISTIIIGAGVYRLLAGALNFNNVTIVDMHGESDEIMLDSGFVTTKNARTFTFYTDNLALRNANYGSNTTIEWHSLSEWEG